MDFEKKYRAAKDEARIWKTMTRICVVAMVGLVGVFCVSTADCQAEAQEAKAQPPEVITVEVDRDPIYYNVPLTHFQQDVVRLISGHYGLDMRLPLAVMQQETGFRNAIGDDGESVGYMQVQQKWHRERMERLGVSDLGEFYGNTLTACDFLAELLEAHPLANALAYYNSGDPALPNQYAESVMDIMDSLEVEHDG